MGSFTVAYSDYSFDTTGTSSDDDTTSYKLSYTVSDDLSITYGSETVERGTLKDGEYDSISASYTTGGMTVSGSYGSMDNVGGTGTVDNNAYEMNVAFAF